MNNITVQTVGDGHHQQCAPHVTVRLPAAAGRLPGTCPGNWGLEVIQVWQAKGVIVTTRSPTTLPH